MVFRIMSNKKFLSFLWIFLVNNIHFLSALNEIGDETLVEDYLICRSCGSDAALSNFIINKQSGKALISSNETVFGKKDILVQIIENPLGIRFEVIVLQRASCARLGVWSHSYSWFPGYAWKLCLCPKCTAHLGWMFEPIDTATKNQVFPSEKGFYVLIVDSVISEKDIKSLLMP